MIKEVLSLLLVIAITLFYYVFIVIMLGVLGHRQTSEITIIELIIVALLGSSVETGMIAGDKSLLAGLVSAGTLLVGDRLFSLILKRWVWLRRIVIGRPIPLIYNGKILTRRMREAGLDEDDIFEGMRARGYADLEKVRLAMLEMDGEISVVPRE